jgi:hypothetical protein
MKPAKSAVTREHYNSEAPRFRRQRRRASACSSAAMAECFTLIRPTGAASML